MTSIDTEVSRTVDEHDVVYGTRWSRVLVLLLPVALVLGGLGASFAKGVIAASFVTQSSSMSLLAGGVRADGVGLIATAIPVKSADGQVGDDYVLRFGVDTATVNSMCLAQKVTVLGQTVTLLVNATDGDPSTYEIKANGLTLDVTSAVGYVGTGGTTAVNKNARDVVVAGGNNVSLNGSPQAFGLQAGQLDLRNIRASVKNVVVPNALATPAFSMNLVPGNKECAPLAAQPGR